MDGDRDADGLDIVADSLERNGGSIEGVGDQAEAELGHPGQRATDARRPVDGIRPQATLSISPTGFVSPNDRVPVLVRFSESVTGLTAGDFEVTNGTAGELRLLPSLNPNVPVYQLSVDPVAEGPLTITLPADAAHDGAGNGNVATQQRALVGDPGRVTITPSTSNTTEGQPVAFEVRRSRLNGERTVQVEVNQQGAFLSGATSFGATITTTPVTVPVIFPASATTLELTLDTDDDYVPEDDGSVTLTVLPDPTEVGYVVGAPDTATASVRSDDAEVVVLILATAHAPTSGAPTNAVEEGAVIRFSVVRSHDVGEQTLDLQLSQVGDFLAVAHPNGLTVPSDGSIQVTIPAGHLWADFLLNTHDDTVEEADGSLTVTLLPRPADLLYPRLAASGTMLVRDDDAAPTVTVSADAASVPEGSAVSFTLARSDSPGESDREMPVRIEVVQTGGVPARETADFAAGATRATVSVQTTDDRLSGGDGSVTLRVLAPSLAATVPYRVGAPDSAVTAVLDDEPPVISVSPVAATVTEGADAEFRLARLGSSSSEIVVGVNISGHKKTMSDATQALVENTSPQPDTTVTFAAGVSEAILALTTEADRVNEGDGEITVAIASSAAYGIHGGGSATLLVEDDDIPEATLRWISPPATLVDNVWVGEVLEGEDIEYTVDCAGNTTPPLDVSHHILKNRILVQHREDLRHPALVLPIRGVHEKNDLFRHVCSGDGGSLDHTTKLGQFRYTAASQGDMTIDLVPQQLSSRGNYWRCYIDEIVGTPVDVRFCPKYTLGDVTSARITVLNRNPTVTVEAIEEAVDEGEPARFRLTRIWNDENLGLVDDGLGFTTTFDFTAAATGDYVAAALPGGARTFGFRETEMIIEVATERNAGPGDDGTVTLELLPGRPESQALNVGGTYEVYDQLAGITPAGKSSRTATVTIRNTDTLPLLSIHENRAEEGETLPFGARLSAPHNREITLEWSLKDGSAKAGSDYVSAAGTLTLAVGETANTIEVATVEDAVPEHDEFVRLVLANPVEVALDDDTYTGIIVDDDDVPVVTIAPKRTPVARARDGSVDSSIEFVVSRQDRGYDTRLAVDLRYARSDETSYTATTTVWIPQGEQSTTFRFYDALLPPDEEYRVTATIVATPARYVVGTPDSATVTVLALPPIRSYYIRLSASPTTFDAVGDEITFTYRVRHGSRTSDSGAPITVRSRLVEDFVISENPLAPGSESSASRTYTVTQDDLDAEYIYEYAYAEDEFVRSGESFAHAYRADRPVWYTIQTDIFQETEVTPGNLVFVTQHGDPSHDHVVHAYTVDETAAAGLDYTATSETLTFVAGGADQLSFHVPVTDDELDEPYETLEVVVEDAEEQGQEYTRGRYSILDNDPAVEPQVNFPRTGTPVESVGDLEAEIFLVRPNSTRWGSGHTVELSYEVLGDTATAGADFARTAGRLTFAPGEHKQSIFIAIVDDGIDEPDERFYIALFDGVHVDIPADRARQAVWILDNDESSGEIALALAPAGVSEDAGGTPITVTATSDAAVRAAPTELTVQVAGGTATAGVDFTAVADVVLTIPSEQSSGTAEFILTPLDDAAVEGPETITVTATTTATGLTVTPTSGVTVQITDDDVQGVRVEPRALTIDEGRSEPYSVALTTVPTGIVTVDVSLTAATDAVTVAPASLTFLANDWDDAQTVTVTAVADADGDGEQATISHTVAGADYGSVSVAPVAVTVRDDETASSKIELVADPTTIAESGGDRTITVTARLDETPRAAATAVRVEVVAGSATPGLDYAVVDAFEVTIAAGTASGSATFALSPVNDAEDEEDETLTLTGQVVEGGIPVPAALPVSAGSVTITDDDTRGVLVSDAELSVVEGESGSYSVRLASAPTQRVAVEVEAPSGADLQVSPTHLYFARDDWSTAQTVRILARADADLVDDTVTLTHAVTGGDYDAIAADDVDVTITEPTWAVATVQDARALEGSGAVQFEVALSRAITGEASMLYRGVAPTASDDAAAQPGEDFVAIETGTLVFAAGETRKTITVTVVDDSLDEADEHFDLLVLHNHPLLAPGDSLQIRTVRGTIEDDDPMPVLTVAGSTPGGWSYGREATGSLAYTVQLNAQSGREVTVDYSTDDRVPAGRSAGLKTATADVDYAALHGTLTFAAGETGKHLTVQVNDDKVSEGDEVFALQLANPRNAVVWNDGWGVIRDDEVRGVVVVPSALTVDEGNRGSYTLALTSQPTAAVTVTLAASDGVTLNARSLTFTTSAWATARTVTVTALDDADAVNGSATVGHVFTGGDYVGLEVADVTVTIVDNDQQAVALSAASLTFAEGDHRTYTVALATQPTGAVTVAIGGTAGTDLSLDADRLTFTTENWNVAQTVRVSAVADRDAQDDEATLDHTARGGDYGLVRKGLPVRVTDHDTPDLVLSETALEVAEGGRGGYTVALATQPTGAVTVMIGGTAGTDLSLDADRLTFTTGNWSVAQTVRVSAAADPDAQNDEAILEHRAWGGDYGPVRKRLPVRVTDDDTPDLVLSETALAVAEGGRGGYTVALATQPAGAVTVTIGGTAGTDLSLSRTALTFTAFDWAVAQTVEVTAGADDDATNDAATLSHVAAGGDYAGVAAADLAVTVTDDDKRGLHLTAREMQVVEGGSKSYAASLQTVPTADVTVRTAVSGSPSVTVSPQSLTFTPTTWHVPQPLTVSAAHDPDIVNAVAVIAHHLSGGDYGAGVLEPEVTVHAIDDDEAPVLAISGPERVTEGDDVVYTVTRHGDHAPELAVGIYVTGHRKIMSPETRALSGRTAPGVTVSFAAGAMQTSLTLTTEADNKVEGSGLLTAAIETTRSDYRVETQAADVFVYDDDVPGVSLEFVFPADTTVVGSEVQGVRLEGPPPNVFVLRCSGDYDTTALRVNVRADVFMNHPIHGYNKTGVPNPVTCDEERIDLATRRQIWTGPDNGEVRYRFEPVEESRLTWICTEEARFCPKFTHDSPDTAVIRVINRNPTITIAADAGAVTEGSPASFVLTRHWNQENLNPDVAVWGETEVALLTSERGGYASLEEGRTVTFVAGQTEMEISIPTVDDTVAGEDGEVVIEILPDTTPDDVNLFGSYEVYDYLDGITPPGGNSRVARVTVLNDDKLPVVEIADASAGEDDGVLEFIVGLREGVLRTEAVTMTWATVAGTATAPDDYTAGTGSLTVAPVDTTATIRVSVVDDAVDEANETLAVELSSVSGAVFDGGGATLQATGTILDDDGDTTAVVSIEPLGSTRVVEGGRFEYLVRRDGRLNAEITAGVQTSSDGTATAGDDYQAVDQDVTFAVGESARTLTVTVADDEIDEPEETFGIELSVATGQSAEVAAGKDAITVTIVDDDSASMEVMLSASPASVAEGSGVVVAQPIEVTAVLDGAVAASALTIELVVAGVSATTTEDFAPVAAFELVIPAQASSGAATFTISPVADAVDEEDETVAVRHGGETSAQLRVTETLVTINDDDERGVAISTKSLSMKEGDRQSYTMLLTSAPTGPVDVQVEVPSRDGVGAGPPRLRFTADDWSKAQTIDVLALEDLDTTNDESEITHRVSGADYGSVAAPSVAVTVEDNDTARAELTLEYEAPEHGDADGDGEVTLGDGLSYEASARNSGNVPLKNVTVSDERVGGAAKTCATLGIGESCEWNGSYTVTQADVDAGKVDNKVTATADDVADQEASQSTSVAQERELTLEKSAKPASFGAVDESIVYTYKVSNSGTVTLAGTVTIDDDKIANGIMCEEVPEEGLGPDGTVTCTGSYTTVQADVDVSEVVNRATATLAGVESNEATARATWRASQEGQPTVQFGVGAVAGVESVGSLRFSVTLSAASLQTVTVGYQTTDVTATAGSDYTAAAVDSVLTFTAGTTQGTIEVVIADDKADEEDETFTVTLSGAANATLAGGEATLTATGTIEDDDDRGVTVNPTELRVTEGASEGYTVVLRSQPTGDVTVAVSVPEGTDVTVDEDSLTFTSSTWAVAQTVTVSAVADDDALADDAVELTHQVSGGDYGSNEVSAEPVEVTIVENDTPTLSVSDARAGESAGEMAFTVSLSQASSAEVVVDYASGDVTAEAGTDYTAATGKLTFTAGTTQRTIEVVIAGDKVDEEEETFTVTLSGAANATLAGGEATLTATGTIEDDDNRGVTVSPTKLRVTEGGSEGYTVVLGSQPTGDVTVAVSVPEGTDVTVDEDSLTFTSSTWAVAQTVEVSAVADDDALADDAVELTHQVSGGDYGSNGVGAVPVEVTIVENDTPTLSVSDARAGEASGGMVFAVTLSQASSAEVVVDYASADVTAEAGTDYTEATGTLTFAAETTAAQEIRVVIADDKVDEEDETFTVTLSGAANAALAGGEATLMATGTIEDDDNRGVTVSPTELRVTEGGSDGYTVVLGSQPTGEVTVAVSVPEGAEFTVDEEELTFGAGDWATAQTVTVTAGRDDDAVAASAASIEHEVSGGDYAGEAAAEVAVTVVEADTARAELTLEYEAPEHDDADGDGEVTLGDKLSYEASAHNSGNVPLKNVTVSDERVGGGAKTCATLGIGESCEWNGSYTVTQADVDAGKVENKVTATADEVGDQEASQRTTVAQERELTLEKSAKPASFGAVDESIVYTYKVSNSGTVTLAGTVTIEDDKIANGITCEEVPEEGLGPDGTVTCTGSYTTVQADVDVSEVVNRATATLAGVESNEDTERATWRAPLGSQTTVQFGVGGVAGVESVGRLRFSVTLSAASLQTVTVDYASADGTAEAGTDYTEATGKLTFTAGTTQRTIEVVIADDKVDEEEETFTMTLSGAENATLGAAATVTGTIVDDDNRGVTVSPTKLRVTEGGSDGYTVVLRSQPTGDVTVAVSVPEGTDVTVDEDSLTFTSSTWAVAQTVEVSAVADDDALADDAVELTHQVSGGDYGSNGVSAETVEVTIVENDTPTLSVSDQRAGEASGEMVFTVTLSQASSAEVVVDYASADVTAEAGTDYTEATGKLTFPATTTAAQEIRVVIADDKVDEGEETFTVTLSGAANAALAGGEATLTATGTIEDDDNRGVTVSPTELRVTEGGSDGYTVVLRSQPTGDVTVAVSVPAGTDVTVDEDSLTFTSSTWAVAQTVEVSAVADDDALADDAVELTHQVSGGDYGSNGVSAETVEVTIVENDTPTLSVSDARAGESAGELAFAVTLSQASSAEVVVDYASADGTAEAGTDYTAATGKLTFTAGATQGTIEVVIADDKVDEANETLTVTLSGAVNAALAGGEATLSATGTIEDDDNRGVTVSPTELRVTEGASDGYTVVLGSQPTGDVTVAVSVPEGTDVTVDEDSLTFTSSTWAVAQTVEVSAVADDDALADDAVELTHQVSGGDYGSNGVSAETVEVTIVENDTPTLSVSDQRAGEASGEMVFTVTLSQASSAEVVVDYASADVTAEAGTDYTEATGKLTFPATTTAAQEIRVVIADDKVDEGEETFTVTLSGAANAALAGGEATLTATGTIEDDDNRGVTVSPTELRVTEGGSDGYTVVLGSQPTGDVTVAVSVPEGTDVTVDEDSLTFTSSTWAVAQTVEVSAVADDDALADDAVELTHQVSGGDYGSNGVSAETVEVTIVENDTPTLSVSDARAGESAGELAFAVTLSQASSAEVVVDYASGDVTAKAGTDYTAATGTLTFPATTTAAQEIRVVIADDKVDEVEETFTVTLSGAANATLAGGGATLTATGTIEDDDNRGVTVSPTELRVTEGGSDGYTVVLRSQPTGEVTVAVSVPAGTVVTVDEDSLTFTSSTWAVAQTVTVSAVADDDALADDAVELTHQVSGGDYGSNGVSAETVEVTIVENDTPTLSVSDQRAGEASGEMVFTVTLSQASSAEVVVDYASADVTAEAGTDYTEATGKLTFPATTTAAQEIRVVIADDKVDEGEETFTVTLSGAANAALAGGEATLTATGTIEDDDNRGVTVSPTELRVTEGGSDGYTVVLRSQPTGDVTVAVSVPAGTDVTVDEDSLTFTSSTWAVAQTVTVSAVADDDALADDAVDLTHQVSGGDYGSNGVSAEPVEVTIVENDTPTLSVSDQRAGEASGEMVFAVTLSQASSAEVMVDYASADGTAEAGTDYTEATGTLTFAAETTAAQEIRVAIADDEVDEEDETFTVTLSGAANAALAGGGTTLSATGTIEDDDDETASTAVTLSVDPASVAEEGGEREITVTGTLDQAPRAQAVAVAVSVTGDTATAAADFVAVADFELTIAAGERSGTGTFALEPVDDEVDEDDETVTVSGAAPGTDLSVTETQVTIIDNDTRGVSVIPTELEVTEDLSGSYNVVLGSQPTDTVTVRMAVSSDDDVTVSPESLTFTTGTWDEAQTITVTAGPNVDGGGTLARLTHQVSGADYEGVPAEPVTVTTPDDDGEPGQPLTVSIADARALESAGVLEFIVEMSTARDRQVTVNYATEAGTATEGADYTRTVGTLTFEPGGGLRHTIAVPIVNDALDEADSETFTVAISGASNATAGAAATGTILDDDAAPELTIADVRAVESTGMMEFTVRLGAPSGRQVEVTCYSEDGTATAGDDYVAELGTLVLEPGQTTGVISVPILDDMLDEEDETFAMMLSDPVNATLADDTATGTIIDNDASVAGMWLSRFGRTVAAHELRMIGARLNGQSPRSPQVTIAGQLLEHGDGGVVAGEPDLFAPRPVRTMDVPELLQGSSFLLTGTDGDESAADTGSGTAARWSAWGSGEATQFAGNEGEVSLQGRVVTATLGADYERGPIVAGVAVSYSVGDGEFAVPAMEERPGRQISVDSSLASVHPYVRVAANERLALWAMLGYGRGLMAMSGADVETGIEMKMGAFGASGALLVPAAGAGLGLDLKSDGFLVLMASDPTPAVPVMEADASRVRLVLDGSLGVPLGVAGVLTPSFEVGVRHDGGDAETGTGLEVGGGVRYVYPAWGLTLAASGRVLVTHRDRGYEEWGAGGSLRVDPGAPGRGLALEVNSSWGTAASGVARLWALPDASELAGERVVAAVTAGRLDAEVGYGLGAGDAVVTPYAGFTQADGGDRAYRLGSRVSLGPSVSLSLEADGRERVGVQGVAPDMGVTLSGTVRW